ncbi:MAG: hypothetical protein LBT35_05825 [Tannerella sp.]|jgi:hypothetical protein|nr:hypothetical protein [Tannerella sp.]
MTVLERKARFVQSVLNETDDNKFEALERVLLSLSGMESQVYSPVDKTVFNNDYTTERYFGELKERLNARYTTD